MPASAGEDDFTADLRISQKIIDCHFFFNTIIWFQPDFKKGERQ